MKYFLTACLTLMLTAAVQAVSDPNLIQAKSTLAYYVLPAVETSGNYSSGLVYNKKISEGVALEAVYTSYKSLYLITNNITALALHRKQRLLELGPTSFSGIIGLGAMYSPAVGGGLVADLGGEAAARFGDNFSFSVPIYGSLFADGLWMNMFAGLNYQLPFFIGHEVFAGYKMEMATTSLSESSAGGRNNSYYALGFRTAL